MGFNILLVDQRAHCKSEGKYITYGVLESRDVLSWIEFLNKQYRPEQVIISGISMGASTVLYALSLPLPKNVKGVIADCGFTSPAEIIAKVGKDAYKINAKPLIPIMDLFCKTIGKFSITKHNTTDCVKKTKLPIMLIHGEKDTFVPCEMSKRAFAECGTNCRLFLSKEAGHGTSFLNDTDALLDELKSFLSECIKG
jgi:pimeloyl-ACP methyl ester carboxylesterase